MITKLAALAMCLSCATSVLAAEAASAASAAQTSSPRLNNAQCEAYSNSAAAVRTPRDLGSVSLMVEVSPQGQAVNSEILEHTTTNYFAHVVQENFSRCRFEPARENDVPVQGRVALQLNFYDHVLVANNAVCPNMATRELPAFSGNLVSVKLRVRFLKSGRVASVDVLQPSDVPALNEAAVKAYRQCHFDPAADNQPAFQEEWITTLNWGG